LIGARLGYALFYNFFYYAAHPLEIFWPVQVVDGKTVFGISGMSYHGGLIGIIIVSVMFCKRHKLNLWKFIDFFIPAVPLGYMFGRLGNFLNGELYGRVTDVWWGMYFPQALSYQLRHPSQLYEAFFEGVVLFIILWSLRQKGIADGFLFSIYLIGYGCVRFFIEFFRQPDEHLGFLLWSLSMGQILCLLMMAVGVLLIRKQKKVSPSTE